MNKVGFLVVLLTMVGPVTGFAQSDNEPPPVYIINHFSIYGSIGVSTEDHSIPRLVQNESMRESLDWVLGQSELIRSVGLRSNGKVIEKSKTPTPLDSIKQEFFEIKRSARTDRISAEINVSASLVASGTSITVKGLQSITLGPIHDDDSHSRATMSVSFGVKVGAEGIVRISGCDVFDKSFFQNQPEFEDNGENCSFQVREQYAGQFKAKPSHVTTQLIESMPQDIREMLAPQTPGYPLTFGANLEAEANGRFGENTEGVVLSKPFKITIGNKSCAVGLRGSGRSAIGNMVASEITEKIVGATLYDGTDKGKEIRANEAAISSSEYFSPESRESAARTAHSIANPIEPDLILEFQGTGAEGLQSVTIKPQDGPGETLELDFDQMSSMDDILAVIRQIVARIGSYVEDC